MDAIGVGRLSVEMPASFSTRGFTQERSPTNVLSVGRPSVRAPAFFSITGFTLGRNHMCVVNVAEPLASILTLLNM